MFMIADDFNTFSKRNLDVMKIRTLIISICLLGNGQILYADALSRTQTVNPTKTVTSDKMDTAGFLKKITPEMLYGYTDFRFDSTSSDNFNRYKGHSNLYSTGADHISFGQSVMAGIYYFKIDTSLNAQFLLNPGSFTQSQQTINNNTIFGHVLKIFTPEIYADVAGGYGYNKITTYTQVAPGTTTEQDTHAINNNDNWFLSLNGIYRKTWKKYVLRANLGVLYSQIDSGPYDYLFTNSGTLQPIQSLTNKATLLLENAELGYFINPKLMPFIGAGLIQVVQFSNSRPIIDPASDINGSLPQLNMNKNGFRLGAGVSYTYKNATVRIEEKYYNSSGTFRSYQSLAALEYSFD